MSIEEKNILVEKYLNDISEQINDKYPNLVNDDKLKKAKAMFLNRSEDYEQIVEEINQKVQEMKENYNKGKEEQQKYLEEMSKKYNTLDYQAQNIKDLNIDSFTYEQLDNLFFHYSWKKYLESYDKNGMKPFVGENSQGIDHQASIFFSKGIEGVLELWDVWLKWRLNRLNNPQYKGNNPEEISETLKRYNNGNISESERKEWYYWIDYYKNRKYLFNDDMLKKLFDFQYNEMISSDYFIMDLKENEEFKYDQEDIKKRWAIENSKKFNRDINPLTLIQYGAYSDFSTTIADKWNMQTIPGKDITIEPSRLKRLTFEGNNDVYSIMKFMYDKYKREVPTDKQVKFDLLDKYVNYVEKKKKNNIEEQQIELSPELVEIFTNIERDSKLSSSELIKFYMGIPEYQQMFKNMEYQSKKIKEQIHLLKLQSPQMSDTDFFKAIISNHSKNIIEIIKKDYGNKLTPEIIERLNNFNISVINNPETRGGMSAHPEKSQVEINEAHFATDVKDIESKIVRAMGTMPHEIFHFVYRILKDEKHCDERMVYNLANGDKATCLGMTGHMLNEGFVEKLSTDFCKRNNIYSTISPRYIQFTKLCDYIMKTNPNINEEFLINNNYEGVLDKISPDAKEKYKETERIEYLRNFKLKTTFGEKRKIDDREVISSYNQKVESRYMDQQTSQQKSQKLTQQNQQSPKKPFTQRTQAEIQIASQIRQKNKLIKQQKNQKRQIDKPKTLVRTKPSNPATVPSKGFIDVITLSLIISFVVGAISMLTYFIISR